MTQLYHLCLYPGILFGRETPPPLPPSAARTLRAWYLIRKRNTPSGPSGQLPLKGGAKFSGLAVRIVAQSYNYQTKRFLPSPPSPAGRGHDATLSPLSDPRWSAHRWPDPGLGRPPYHLCLYPGILSGRETPSGPSGQLSLKGGARFSGLTRNAYSGVDCQLDGKALFLDSIHGPGWLR